MRLTAAFLFAAGLLLAVRVMFFGVRRTVGGDFVYRSSRLAVAAGLAVVGAALYALASVSAGVTLLGVLVVALLGTAAAAGAWWLVRASAVAGSSDPEDDPRYMYQGFVGRVLAPIADESTEGRIALSVDGRAMELNARWSTAGGAPLGRADVGSEVVIEVVEGDVAYVEPWALVEGRL